MALVSPVLSQIGLTCLLGTLMTPHKQNGDFSVFVSKTPERSHKLEIVTMDKRVRFKNV